MEEIEIKMNDLEVVYENVSALVKYENNANLHSDEQVTQIANSILQFGFCDPIAVWTNKDGKSEIVAGHGRLLAAIKLGLNKVPVIHLDSLTDEQRRAYTHVHNQQTRNSEWDYDILDDELENLDFDWEALGFDVIDEPEETESQYSEKTESFIYEPVDSCPSINSLVDMEKANRIKSSALEEYNKGNITAEQYDFLFAASSRHIVFDYGKIADYYACQDNSVMQELMEDSALVIIDYDQAIENGYVKLRDSLALIMEDEQE